MSVLMAIGGVLAAFMLVQALQPEVSIRVVNENLDYRLALPFAAWVLAVPYVLVTCLTPILSSHLWIRVFGVGNFLAMSAAAFIESRDYSSIWCTMAAFLSLIIFVHYWELRRRRLQRTLTTPAFDPA